MLLRKFCLPLAAGVVLLFSNVAFSQPIFAPPVNVGPPINTASHEWDPFLTVDGKKLFFVSQRDTTLSIWFAEWSDTGWTNPKKLNPQINAGISGKWSPSVPPDGKKLYYVDDSRQGFFWDIWVSEWDSVTNDWGSPQNLGWPVNTPGVEFSAHIAPDGRHLYFSSISDSVDSLNPNGRCAIYVSKWNDSSWSIPIKIPVTQCVDEYPSISADGRWFYFHRSVSGVETNIFVSESTGSGWGPPYNLSSQIDGPASAPFITPSGESLFFHSSRTGGGFGGVDIWMSELISVDVKDNEDRSLLPRTFELYQNYPNPFNSTTKIKLFVSKRLSEPVDLIVYNLLGDPVRLLIRREVVNGLKEVEWDGTDDGGKEVSSGIYFIRLKVGDRSAVKKAILVK